MVPLILGISQFFPWAAAVNAVIAAVPLIRNLCKSRLESNYCDQLQVRFGIRGPKQFQSMPQALNSSWTHSSFHCIFP